MFQGKFVCFGVYEGSFHTGNLPGMGQADGGRSHRAYGNFACFNTSMVAIDCFDCEKRG